MRVLATYYEIDDAAGEPRCLQLDVSREKGIWALSHLLSGGQVAEIRFVGENEEAVGVARMLARAGKLQRPAAGPKLTLKLPGDESYPRLHPFVHICPDPDRDAFK